MVLPSEEAIDLLVMLPLLLCQWVPVMAVSAPSLYERTLARKFDCLADECEWVLTPPNFQHREPS